MLRCGWWGCGGCVSSEQPPARPRHAHRVDAVDHLAVSDLLACLLDACHGFGVAEDFQSLLEGGEILVSDKHGGGWSVAGDDNALVLGFGPVDEVGKRHSDPNRGRRAPQKRDSDPNGGLGTAVRAQGDGGESGWARMMWRSVETRSARARSVPWVLGW